MSCPLGCLFIWLIHFFVLQKHFSFRWSYLSIAGLHACPLTVLLYSLPSPVNQEYSWTIPLSYSEYLKLCQDPWYIWSWVSAVLIFCMQLSSLTRPTYWRWCHFSRDYLWLLCQKPGGYICEPSVLKLYQLHVIFITEFCTIT